MLFENQKTLTIRSKNDQLFSDYLTTNDVTLYPGTGVLNSRSKAIVDPFIFSAPMDTVTGLALTKEMVRLNQFPVVCRFTQSWEDTFAWWIGNGCPSNVWFAIGLNDSKHLDILEKNASLINKINLCVDVAHGDSLYVYDYIKKLRSLSYVDGIMSGSICTPQGALASLYSGCTHLRIGVGPGAACTTRLMTGFGLPNLTAVYSINSALEEVGMRQDAILIADGGIKNPGDAVKYIAAGANAVMLGNEFSTTHESDGWELDPKFDKLFKNYRGQASASFQKSILGKTSSCPEGATGPLIKPTCSVEDVVCKYIGGMQSAISYAGYTSMREMNPYNVIFKRITASGWIEGTPHGTK
jgi:IMP dehydrogenase